MKILYTYCMNNPLKYIDPDGRECLDPLREMYGITGENSLSASDYIFILGMIATCINPPIGAFISGISKGASLVISEHEKEEQLEDIVDSYFRLYDTGRITIKDIDFALDSYNEKDRNYIINKLKEKGVPIDKDTNSTNDNEKKDLPGGGK